MRHRVELQRPSVSKNQYHDNIETWTTVDTIYADIRPMSANETIVASQRFGTVTHKMVTRHREDEEDLSFVDGTDWTFITGEPVSLVVNRSPAQRAQYGGRTFDIIGQWDIGERHRFDEFLLREISVPH